MLVITDAQTKRLFSSLHLASRLFGALRNIDDSINKMHIVTHDVYQHLMDNDLEVTKVDMKT